MKFNGQSLNIDWDHAIDVYGERHNSDYCMKKRNGESILRKGTGGMPKTSKKDLLEVVFNITDTAGKIKFRKEYSLNSYKQVQELLTKYKLTELAYPQFMIWLNNTSESCVVRADEVTYFIFTMDDYQFESAGKLNLQSETSDDIILPRGNQ